jgi:hypothetical protein
MLLLAAAGAQAQAPAAGDGGRSEPARRERAPLAVPDDLEPAVDVGGTRLAVAQGPADATQPPRAAATQASTVPAPTPPVPPVAAPAPSSRSAAVSGPRAPTPPATPRSSSLPASDSIDLGTTSITGNQELPKVLYIVPWKKSDLGDLVGRPVNTLLDEVLAPVDPEVFERHLQYYETLYGKGQEE